MAVAATGFFDGVHLGHRAVLDKVKEIAEECGSESAVVTFWPHPRIILHKDESSLRLLNTLQEKERLIRRLGIGQVIVIPFTESFSRLTAREFIRELRDTYAISHLVIGYDHLVGSDRVSADGLSEIAEQEGMETFITGRTDSGAAAISSTRIRKALAEGDIRSADEMLGYHYLMTGIWQSTQFRPSDSLKMIPKEGEYAVKVESTGTEREARCIISHDMSDAEEVSILLRTSSPVPPAPKEVILKFL